MSNRILRLPAVCEKSGLARSTIYRLMETGKFPRAIKLSERAIGWREEDIEQWLSDLRNRPAEICKAAGKLLSLQGVKGHK